MSTHIKNSFFSESLSLVDYCIYEYSSCWHYFSSKLNYSISRVLTLKTSPFYTLRWPIYIFKLVDITKLPCIGLLDEQFYILFYNFCHKSIGKSTSHFCDYCHFCFRLKLIGKNFLEKVHRGMPSFRPFFCLIFI